MLIDGFRFGGGLFHGFAAAGCAASGFAMMGSVAAGYEALGLAALSLAVVRFKQRPVYETTGVTKTAECNAAKPNVGKAVGLSMPFPADVTINQF